MQTNKKNILFLATEYGKNNYMGGLYYIKNMVFALLKCEKACNTLHIIIYVDSNHATEFNIFRNTKEVSIVIKKSPSKFIQDLTNYLEYKFRNIVTFHSFDISKIIKKYHVDIIFPSAENVKYQKKCIYWIPDFQHEHYSHFFSKEELQKRKTGLLHNVEMADTIILSSQDAYHDFIHLYDFKKNVFVVPFVSAIQLPQIDAKTVLKKYQIDHPFYLISNQFYAHKNHITVFKAIELLKKKGRDDIFFVFTGLMNDYRNPAYVEEIKNIILSNNLNDCCAFLGLIKREDQIILIHECVSIIQPSLFEGWNTLIEDAKTLKQNIIASDIDVHMEQKVENCIYFEKENEQMLAQILEDVWDGRITFSQSTYDYNIAAQKYGELFYNAICCKIKHLEDE